MIDSTDSAISATVRLLKGAHATEEIAHLGDLDTSDNDAAQRYLVHASEDQKLEI